MIVIDVVRQKEFGYKDSSGDGNTQVWESDEGDDDGFEEQNSHTNQGMKEDRQYFYVTTCFKEQQASKLILCIIVWMMSLEGAFKETLSLSVTHIRILEFGSIINMRNLNFTLRDVVIIVDVV